MTILNMKKTVVEETYTALRKKIQDVQANSGTSNKQATEDVDGWVGIQAGRSGRGGV